jgi:hypothetical protein
MEDLNKITSTKVGDNIHFFVNGAEDKGTVVKMDSKFVTVVKDDGNFQDIHINDTFFIKDILVNKTWNDMTMEERTVELHKIHAYSPRFLAKSWQELPKELKDVMKSNIEQGHLGGGGRSGHAVETSTAFDAEEDYEGESHDTKEEQFKHDKEKPKVTKKSSRAARGGNMNSGTTLRPSDIKDLQNLDGSNNTQATPTSETKYFGAGGKQITREEHEKTKTYGSMQEQLWEQWLDKDGGMGGGSPPASTSSNSSAQTNDSGMYNPVYGDKGRHGGQGRDKEEEDKEEEKERKG